jgi:hypothetical protein
LVVAGEGLVTQAWVETAVNRLQARNVVVLLVRFQRACRQRVKGDVADVEEAAADLVSRA